MSLHSRRPALAPQEPGSADQGQGHKHFGFPKLRGTFWGIPKTKAIVFGGLYWGTLILGHYHLLFTLTPYILPTRPERSKPTLEKVRIPNPYTLNPTP